MKSPLVSTVALLLVVGACAPARAPSQARSAAAVADTETARVSTDAPTGVLAPAASGEGAAPTAAAPPARDEADEEASAPVERKAEKGSSAAVGGAAPAAKVARSSAGPSATSAPLAPGRRPPELAVPGVRAGEWDDNANYRDFLGYMGRASALGIEPIDVSARRFVVVTDSTGSGVPNCEVVIRDERQHSAKLKTAASGRAVLFPRALGLGNKLTANTSCAGSAPVSVPFDLNGQDGVVRVPLNVVRPDVSAPAVDLAFVLDTTGSMAEEIEAVKSTLRAVLSKLDPKVRIRVGLVEYKDRGDEYVTRSYPFTADVKSLSASVGAVRASGGGDTPEDLRAGLSVAVTRLAWDPQAAVRLAFVIADAPPHLDYQDGARYSDSARLAAEKGIKLFTVAASGMDDLGQAVFRQLAQVTGGTNLFVLRGGAGPQSVGGGEPTSACGGAHQNYSSGNLDALILRKLEMELTSLRADPLRIPGVGKDENAKPCGERVLVVAR